MGNEYPHTIVSVTIVTYNSASDIEDCLQAVMGQSFPVTSVIVVDNAATEGTSAIVVNFGEPVRCISNTINNGSAGGQNQAIAIMCFRLIFWSLYRSVHGHLS